VAISFENRYRCKAWIVPLLVERRAAAVPRSHLSAARDVTDEKRTAKELERRRRN